MSNKVRHAQLNVITGPMFCGKSTELLRRLNISAEMGQKVLYVNHSSHVPTKKIRCNIIKTCQL